MSRTCSISGCDRPFVAREMCMMHYQRKRGGRRLDTPDILTCPHCAETFRPKVGTQRFCSPKCRDAHKSARAALGAVTRTCVGCGAEYTRGGRGKHRYCSPACRELADRVRTTRHLYGLDVEAYKALLLAHPDGCAICGRQEGRRSARRLSVDHDHATGTIRGLLCHRCNAGLGQFRDDPTVLRKAIEYLEASAS